MFEIIVLGLLYYIFTKNKTASTADKNKSVIVDTNNKGELTASITDYPIGTVITPTVEYINNPVKTSSVAGWTHRELRQFAESQGFYVTSDIRQNSANHRAGKAIDVRTRDKTNAQVNAFIALAKSKGITVYDERTNIFNSPNWTAEHLHLQV